MSTFTKIIATIMLCSAVRILQRCQQKFLTKCGNSQINLKNLQLIQHLSGSSSTNVDFIESTKKANSLLSQNEMDDLMAAFPSVVKDCAHEGFNEISDHLTKLLTYLVPNGKKNRAGMFISAYKMLEKEQNLTSEDIRLANILAWIIEMFASFMVLIDDIVDQSDMRRGSPTWHTLEGRNLESIIDGICLEQGTYFLLNKHFSNHQCYLSLVQLFQNTGIKTMQGQIIDGRSNQNQQPNWKYFTMTNFNLMANLKTTHYTFYLPLFSAMHLANINDLNIQKHVENIILQLGEFYQIQNDFWDCYTDSHLTGKDGNDIREGKCTWLAVMAFEKANSEQRKIMIENYGKSNTEAENAVRKVYDELDLQTCYAHYEERSLNNIRNDIQRTPEEFPHELLFKILEKIYKKH